MSPNELEQHQTQTSGPPVPSGPLPEVDSALKVLIDLEHKFEGLRATVADVEQRERRLAEQESSARNAVAEAEKRRQEAESRLRESESRKTEIEEQARSLKAKEQELGERERDLEDSQNAPAAVATEAELNRLRAEAAASREEADWTGAALADVQRQLAEARSARQTVENDLKSMKAQQPTPLARADMFCRSRRQRLGAVRRRLKDDAKKLEQISRVLSERQAKVTAAEKMVALQKSSLLEAEAARDAAEKARNESTAMLAAARRVQERYEKRGAAATSATFVASSLIVLTIISVGAWIGVNRWVQPTCRASSVISMSPDADTLGDEAAAAWEGFVSSLPDDPRFLEYAASRYKARAVKELDSPTSVGAMLGSSFAMEVVGPGRISTTLTGTGAGHTAQTLTTLATSIATYANETRDMRADGASTASETAPAEQAEVIDDTRMPMFGLVAGIGAGVALLVLMIAWRSLRGAVIRAVRETAEALPLGTGQDPELATAGAPKGRGEGEIRRNGFRP